jgi:ribosomal protein L17
VTQLLNHENIYDACQKAKELQKHGKHLAFVVIKKNKRYGKTLDNTVMHLFAKRGAKRS